MSGRLGAEEEVDEVFGRGCGDWGRVVTGFVYLNRRLVCVCTWDKQCVAHRRSSLLRKQLHRRPDNAIGEQPRDRVIDMNAQHIRGLLIKPVHPMHRAIDATFEFLNMLQNRGYFVRRRGMSSSG